MLPMEHTCLAVQVCTILSQNTTDVNSARAFAKLKQKFPEWEMVRTANNGMPLSAACKQHAGELMFIPFILRPDQ